MASSDLPTPASDLPAPAFDRAEVSAILRRAVEVASTEPEVHVDRLSADDLAAVAREVGLPPAALARALAESRVGATDRPTRRERLARRLVGPSRVQADSPLSGDEAAAIEAVKRWLEVENGLEVYLRNDGVIVGTKRRGVAGALGSSMRRIQGTGGLDRTRSVQAATAGVEEARAVIVVADVSNKRNEAVTGGSVVAGGTMVVVGLVAAATGPAALVGLPVAAVIGIGTARLTHRRTVVQVTRQVEATTHAAAREERPVHPVERMLRPALPGRRSSRSGK